jgi:hypothetical protein
MGPYRTPPPPAEAPRFSSHNTIIYDDRIVQARTILAIADARHVTDEPSGKVVLTGSCGATVSLSSADIPEPVRRDVVDEALRAAVAAAEKVMALGSAYHDVLRLHGIDATTLYGYEPEITIVKVSAPLAEVSRVEASGLVHTTRRESFYVVPSDLVLAALLRSRGLLRA